MQILSLSQEIIPQLEDFLLLQRKSDSQHFFAPHAYDRVSLEKLVKAIGQDVYLVAVHQNKVLAYGMLRGWDAGFSVPSLGIAVSSGYQGIGLGRGMMGWLHCNAVVRGAVKVRLRVLSTNENAIKLYRSLGYEFATDIKASDYLIGYVNLKMQS